MTSSRKLLLLCALSNFCLVACSDPAVSPAPTARSPSKGSGGDVSQPPVNDATSTTGNGTGIGLGACAKASLQAALLPANLLFIVDRSGSMNCNLPPTTSSEDCETNPVRGDPSQPSKWEVVRDSLKSALASLPSTATAGITYFSSDDQCGVQSQPNVELEHLDSAHLDALAASLDAVKPKGGTPIVGATINAYKRLNPNQYADQPYGNRFVVLLTDGAESCNADQVSRLVDTEAPKAVEAHIKTFVLGAPGSERARPMLSKLAYNGGTASSASCARDGADANCHFDMSRQSDFARALSDTLKTVTGAAVSCEIPLPQSDGSGGPVDTNQVNVQYAPKAGADPIPIYQDPNKPCAGGADGWQYASDKTRIVVCGPACDAVRSAVRIDIVLGCAIVIL